MFEIVKNALSRLERNRAKRREHENPPERTPFQKWSDEYESLASKVENILGTKPRETEGDAFEAWRKTSLEPLMRELMDFKQHWDTFRGGAFSSEAILNIDALIEKAQEAKTRGQENS